MKKSLLTFLLSGCIGISLAQTSKTRTETKDYKNYPFWIEMMQDPNANFFETQKAFNMYWKGREIKKGGGYKPFKRWEHFMAQQVDVKGNKPQATQILNEIEFVQNTATESIINSTNSQWEEVGPVELPNNGTGQPNGLGRVNAIGFHPTDPNTFYAGAPAGGLWKTTDGGSNWSSSTDGLATLGVSSIVVDYSNTNLILIGTGDRDANDSPGLGVFKSTDGGSSWSQSNSGMGNRTVGEMVQDPTNSDVFIAATNGGIYRSTNGGSTWSQSQSGNFKDLKLHPTNSSVVYATTGGNLYKSTNNGASFSLSMSGIPSGKSRLVIGVSPAAPNTVYILAAQGSVYGGLFKSTNSGGSFTTQSTTPNIMDYSTNGSGNSGQAWYDMCIAVNPTNANEVYVGGVNVFKSTNSGSNCTINAHWVGSGGASAVHADQHILRYSPGGKLYAGNDGGVYHKSTTSESWTDISSGLAISQCYKIGQSQTDVNRVIVGYQDNGTGVYDNGNWRTEIGGDGMESAIDYTNSAYMYGELYYGAIRRSTNNGYSFQSIAGNGVNGITESGGWVTPYVLHEQDPNTMFIGYKDIWRSTNVKASSSGSISWTEISTNLGGSGNFTFLEHNEANGNILYAVKGSSLYKSENVMASNVTWTQVAVPGSGSILSVETNELNENIVYLTRGSKIYQSNDKGVSWNNISANIANSQYKTSLVYAPMVEARGLYVATDYGVFFKPENETDWITYSLGLPNYAKIKEIEIYEDQSGNGNHKIRAASYGRGLWSNNLYITGEVVTVDNNSINICTGSSATITADNALSYFWTDPSGTVVGNSAILNVSPATTTVYTVNGIIANGDTTQAFSTVNVLNPTVSILGQTTVCDGSSTLLTASASGVGTYTYTWSNGQTGASINVSPTSATTYSVTATSAEGCTAVQSHQIGIVANADYVVVELKTDNYPSETSWTLKSNAGNIYASKNQGAYTSANTIYRDTVFCVTELCLVFDINDTYGDGICCSYGQGHFKIFQSDGTLLSSGGAFNQSASTNFCIQPQVFSLSVVDSVISSCSMESTTFTASGADSYYWTDVFGMVISNNASLTVSESNSMNYIVYGIQNGDTLSQEVSLEIEDITVSISGPTEVCEGDLVTLTGSGADSYIWSNSMGGGTSATSNSSMNEFYAVSSETIYVYGSSSSGCLDTNEIHIVVNENPSVNLSLDNSACVGDAITVTATGADHYVWSTGDTTESILVESLTTGSLNHSVWVIGTNNGCSSDTVFQNLTWVSNPVLAFTGNTTYCQGEFVQIAVTGADSYLWSNGSTSNSISFQATVDTSFTISGMSNGCNSEDLIIDISVNDLPEVSILGNTEVCSGDSIQLIASGADSYVWSNGMTGSSIQILGANTNISVIGTVNGCSSEEFASLSIIENPTITVSGDNQVCLDDSIVLTANGADSYIWSNGMTGSSVVLYNTSTNANVISVTGTLNGCSSEMVETNLIWMSNPNVSITGEISICLGETSTLTASGADTYLWSTGEVTPSIEFSGDSNSTITVEGFLNGCLSSMASHSIVVNEMPDIEILGNTDICFGDSVHLTATGADSYLWSTGETSSSISILPITNQLISVTGVSNSCETTASVGVTVMALPLVEILGNEPTCETETIILTASGADTYLWSTGETSQSIIISNGISTNSNLISVVGTTNGCNSIASEAQLTWLSNPEVEIEGVENTCEGDSVILTASGADSYLWSNGETSSSISILATNNATFSVVGMTNGCSSESVSHDILVESMPVVSILGNTEYCSGDLVTLVASGANTYSWSTGSQNDTLEFIATNSTIFTVEGTNTLCSILEEVEITVIATPIIEIVGEEMACEGDSVLLTAVAASSNGTGSGSYLWSTGETTNSIYIHSSSSVDVIYTMNGCSSEQVSHSVQFNENPLVTISGTTEICSGDLVTLIANGADSYLWSTGDTTETISFYPSASTAISVQGFIGDCSSNMANHNVVVNEQPNPIITGNSVACIGDTLFLNAMGGDSYLWSTGDSTSNIAYIPTSNEIISVQVISNDCMVETDVNIQVVAEPVITVSGNTNVCIGELVTLIASGADTYLWSDGTTGNSITFTAQDSMDISVIGTVGGCASASESVSINTTSNSSYFVIEIHTDWYGYETTWELEDAQGNVVAEHTNANGGYYQNNSTYYDTVYCALIGDCYTFTIKDSYGDGICCSYGQGYYNIIQNDGTVLISGGSFNYTETQEFCIAEPIFALTMPFESIEVCEGDLVELSSSGAISYEWTDVAGNVMSENEALNMTAVSSAVYMVTGISGSDTASAEVEVIVTEMNLSISGSEEICKGDKIWLHATGGFAYEWSTGQTSAWIQVAPEETTTYTVTSYSANGCEFTTSHTVEVIDAHKAKIVIKTDWYGYETSWKLKDSSGDVVASNNQYYSQSNKKYTQTVKCLTDECYTLEVYDSYGDGMCCAYGYGYFKVIDENGVVLANGGQFGYQTSASFCFDGNEAAALPFDENNIGETPYMVKTNTDFVDNTDLESITLYPNPAHNEITIDAMTSDKLINRYEITDIAGRVLESYTYEKAIKKSILNISNYYPGNYIIKLYSKDEVKLIKFVKQ